MLRRHEQIFELAQTHVLAEQEFSDMVTTLEAIALAFRIRFLNLMECWRQQRLDSELQMACFAGGMYSKLGDHPVCVAVNCSLSECADALRC
jgi:hypothetical protein